MIDRSVLLTGGSGFLGKAIKARKDNHILSLGRSVSNDIICDLAKDIPELDGKIYKVIHCAGKAHVVPKTKQEKQVFFDVNVQGTKNLLEGLEDHKSGIQQFVFISTIAVYGKDQGRNISEEEPLLGDTPYAKSKIEAEQVLINWSKKHSIPLVILRLPLIVGDYPPGNLGAIIKAIQNGRYVRIRNNNALKSVVLAHDVANLISNLNGVSGIYNLTDGKHPSFKEIEDAIGFRFKKKIKISLPIELLRMIAKVGDLIRVLKIPFPLYSERLNKMISSLTFSDEKARKELNWNPNPVLDFIRTEIK